MHVQPYSAPYRKYVGYMHAVSICKGCGETVIDLEQGIFQKGSTNKLQILNHCSKDFQCRIVAFMLNIRQWYYILRRDSKFLLACVLLSPSVNEEVFSQQFTHHNKYSSTSFKQRLPAVFDGNNTFNNIIFPRCSRS